MQKILVSSCLLGANVRYDGENNGQYAKGYLQMWHEEGRIVTICPEVAGGLPVPRPAAEIVGEGGGEAVIQGHAKVITLEGTDVSKAFLSGASQALSLIQKHHIKIAILKARSPSCGNSEIYDGTHSKKRIPGVGVTSALLMSYGVKVFNEEQLDQANEYLQVITR